MKTIDTASITAAATATASTLWDCVESTHNLALTIATLCQASNENFKVAGEALAIAWSKIGGGVSDFQATRHLVEACHGTSMGKKSASKFLNAMDLVSKQRISQLLAVVYDGDKSKNNGNKPKAEGEKSQDGLDKSAGFTFEQILAAIKSLPSITKEQAQVAAATLASKIA